MTKIKTKQLQESLISGEEFTSKDLADLLAGQVLEDLHLEYKHGDILKKKAAPRTLRRYLGGFANSAGGILIIGVDENTWKVTGCMAPGGFDLARWASTCITEIAHYFAPLPRFQVVEHPAGDVLIAVTDRSGHLIPIYEAGEIVYYFRIHDQTFKAPSYLVGDIILGRRERPKLIITSVSINPTNIYTPSPELPDIQFAVNFTIENEGLSWAENVRVGIISWVLGKRTEKLNTTLGSYIDTLKPKSISTEISLVHSVGTRLSPSEPDIEPFGVRRSKDFGRLAIPANVNGYVWKAAAYMVAKNSTPIWYQLQSNIKNSNHFFNTESRQTVIEVLEAVDWRPVVAWEGIKSA